MESKYVMELIDRLLEANDQVTELMCKVEEMRKLMHAAQEKEANYCLNYREKGTWTLDGATVYVNDLQRIFGFYNSPKAEEILKGEADD